MEDELIKLKTARLAKEKGFNELCLHSFDRGGDEINESITSGTRNSEWGNESCTRPTQSLLQRWLRKVHGINIVIVPEFECYNIQYISKYDKDYDENHDFDLEGMQYADFETYEQALEEGLKYALDKV